MANDLWRQPYSKAQIEAAVAHQIPTISGTTGNWLCWDVENMEWGDTGVPAAGKNPYIGSDNFWYVWDPAQNQYVKTAFSVASDAVQSVNGVTADQTGNVSLESDDLPASAALRTLLGLASGAVADDAFSAVLNQFAASAYAIQKLGLSGGALTNAAVDKLTEFFNTYTWVKTHYDPDIAGTTTPTSAYTVANSNYKYVAYADSYELTVENGVFYVALINPSFITATMSGTGASTLQGALRGKYMIVPGSSSGGVTRAPIGGSNPGNWGGTGGQVMKISSSATFSYVSSDPAIKVATGGLSLVYVLPKSTSTILTSTSSSAYPQNAWNGVDYYDFRGTLLAGAEGTLRSAVITFEGAYTTADLSMEIVLPFTAKAFMLSAETKGTSGAVSSGSTSMAIWVAGQTYIPVSGTASTAIYAAVVQSGNTITITPASVNDALKKAKWRMIAFG